MVKIERPLSVWMSTGEVAAVFGIPPSTVTRWSRIRRLVCIPTLGRHRRIPTSGVANLMAEPPGRAVVDREQERR